MATLTNMMRPSSRPEELRPFEVHRDLAQVADLVEQCFADTLDPDGERYLQQMRSAARNPGFLGWASAASDWASVPLTGYVWEHSGRLVGNISLIPFLIKGRRFYLIANVAVHPDYRRQGIAHSLTVEAVEHARRRGAPSVWLHVRENNTPALHLYRELGFEERARRTTWYTQDGLPLGPIPPGLQVTARRPSHWPQQARWLKQLYPPELTWHLPINLSVLRPGLIGAFSRILSGSFITQWSALRNGKLRGVLAWQSSRGFADTLWLAAPEENEESASLALLLHARRRLSSHRPLSLDYPAHQAEQAITAAGFYPHQTLIWMELSLK